jgi:hypothetical protein
LKEDLKQDIILWKLVEIKLLATAEMEEMVQLAEMLEVPVAAVVDQDIMMDQFL